MSKKNYKVSARKLIFLLALFFSLSFFYSNDNPDSFIDIPKEYLDLEKEYTQHLEQIITYKESNPELYWFIVSWLKTNYGTPTWKNYGSKNWRNETKKSGIDCSGFTRVMQEEIYGFKIKGSSQQLLDNYCEKIKLKNIKEGDLLFFTNPHTTSKRITHVAIYLDKQIFVHATSKKSAAKGQGLRLDSLESSYWTDGFIAAGRIKDKYKK